MERKKVISALWFGMAALMVLTAALLCSCTGQQNTAAASAGGAVPAADEAAGQPTEKPSSGGLTLEALTLEQKVGQLFMVRPDALDPTQTRERINAADAAGVTELTEPMRETLAHCPVGGICQFGKNIESPEQLLRFNQALQSASDIPLLLAVDEEGGRVARLANHQAFDLPHYQSAAAVGETGDPREAYEMGRTIGAYLREYGFNMDFAPVADVNTNPDNPVIGTRAFSADCETAAAMALEMARGLESQGVLPTFKHFPGHGDTAEDSHTGLAVSRRTKEELLHCELLPYQQAAAGKGPAEYAVMVGHIAVPELTGDDVPASLSAQIVTCLLRQELNAAGSLVVTDSLAMQAITDAYGPGEAAVAALEAGCDLLLMPDGLEDAYQAVLTAVRQGRISERRLDESVGRILQIKQQF